MKVRMNHLLLLNARADHSILVMISFVEKANERTVIKMHEEIAMEIILSHGADKIRFIGRDHRKPKWLRSIGWTLIQIGGWMMYKTRRTDICLASNEVNDK